MDLQTVGRAVVVVGIALTVAGGLLWTVGRIGLGSLPGDIKASGPGYSFGAPIVTSIVLSIVLTIVLNVLWRIFGR